MTAAGTAMIEEGIEHPQYCSESRLDDVGAVHVIYLKVIGLSGILLDSQRTKATVSRNKDVLIPPRQMKASLAVVRGNQVYGISPDSKRLSRILPVPTPLSPTNMADEGAVEQQPHHQQQQGQRPVRRYIAVWDNSTIKATTKPNGELVTSTADSTMLFETSLGTNTNAWKDTSSSPDEHFELIVGLTSPATTDESAVTIPIGIACLPIREAAAMRGSSGKVVLDLPIQNISEVRTTTNPFPASTTRNSIIGESNITVKSKRNLFAVLGRRKKASVDNTASKSNTGLTTTSKRPCIYTLDTSIGNDSATLRVELELHEKETNVEIGLSSSIYSDEPYTILMNTKVTEASEVVQVVLTEVSDNDVNDTSIETSTHSTSSMLENRNSTHDDEYVLSAQSIERVLSIRPVPWTFKAKSILQLSPVRRFRVKSHENDHVKFHLTPVPAATSAVVALESMPDQLVVVDEENDVKTRILDTAIQRILSMQESGDQFDNEDDVPLNKIDVPFDEQSFLSGDTEVIRKKSFLSKKPETTSETLNDTPPSLNFKPEPSVRKSMIGSIWSRNKRCNTADTSSTTISISGTESSTHSISNKDSDIESPPRTVKKIMLPDVHNMLFSSVIDVPPTDRANTREEVFAPSLTDGDKGSVVKPVSILRNTNKSTPSAPLSSSAQGTNKVESKMDTVSVISTAETEVKKNTKPRVDYEDHFNLILKDLNVEKIPASDGPDTDATESMQSSSTSTTPPSPDSTYSTSLPSFVAEDTKPVIMEERTVAPTVKNVEAKTPLRKKRAESTKTDNVKVAESTNTGNVKPVKTEVFEAPHQKRCILSKRNILTQNLYGLIDIQPCTAKLDQFLVPDDDEIISIDESWINEASTIDTFKTQRKGTIHDDIADLGLLWGDMCRQTGFQGNNDDDSLLAEEGRRKEKIGTKQRWIAGLRRWHSQRSNEYDEVDEDDLSHSSGVSGGSFTDEHTLRSTTEESESGFSEVGTEVDVNDSNGDRDCTFESSPKQTLKTTEAHTLSARFTNRWTKSSIDQAVIVESPQTETTSVQVPIPNRISSLPPKAPTSTSKGPACKIVVETVPGRVGSYNGGGSNADSATPQSIMPPKSIAQSVVDFVEYVISPSPTSFTTSVNNIPTELETDDAASIGELTATTYERQVEVDEMRRQSNSQQLLATSSTPLETNVNEESENTAEQAPQITTVASVEKSYFSEYDGTDSLSPEVAAAMEAAAAKQMADVLN